MSKEFADLSGIMAAQVVFERETRGTDIAMSDHNTPEYILTRGIKGEADECLEALEDGSLAEAKIEAVDILIFLSSLFNHLNMDSEEVAVLAEMKMMMNFYKYNANRFDGVTLDEGIRSARATHAHIRRLMMNNGRD